MPFLRNFTRLIGSNVRNWSSSQSHTCIGGVFPSQCARFASSSTQDNDTSSRWVMSKLSHRNHVLLHGPDTVTMLQGLITNDMRYFSNVYDERSLHCMQLDIRGRVAFDLIIYKLGEDKFIVEVDRDLTDSYVQTMKKYRLRKKVEISVLGDGNSSQGSVCLFDANANDVIRAADHCAGIVNLIQSKRINELGGALHAFPDPRLSLLGVRLPVIKNLTHGYSAIMDCMNVEMDDVQSTQYTAHRYKLGVAEGAKEMPSSKALPLEYNLDYLNGVSFHKGCYIGQELTARTHHTGVVRKRVMPFRAIQGDWRQVEPGTNVYAYHTSAQDKDPVKKNRPLGKFRACDQTGTLGLMVLNIEQAGSTCRVAVDHAGQTIIGEAYRPEWWPHETDTSTPDGLVKGFQPNVES